MAEIVPVDQFLDLVPRLEAGAHRRTMAADEVRPVHARRTSHGSGSSTSTGPAASRHSGTPSSPTRRGRHSSPHTNCRCRLRRPGATHGRPIPVRGRSSGHLAMGDRVSRRTNREEHAPVPRQLRCDLGGAEVGARARARVLRELRLRGQVAGRDRSVHRRLPHVPPGRGRSTSRSCTHCSGSTCSSTVCARNGIDPGNIAKMLQGRDSKIMETDREMWDLADEAKRLGIADLFEHEPEQIRDRLSKAGGNASIWLTKFDDFLKVHGWRTEGIADINIPRGSRTRRRHSGSSVTSCPMEERHDFDSSLVASHLERDEAIDAARSQLNGDDLGAFNELLGINRRQLCVVERGPQLLHRSACVDSLRRGALAPAQQSGPTTTTTRRSCSSPNCRTSAPAKCVEGQAVDRHRSSRVLRPLPGPTHDHSEGRRNSARQGRGPGADRDLRHAQPLLRRSQEQIRTRRRSTDSPRRPARTPAGRG